MYQTKVITLKTNYGEKERGKQEERNKGKWKERKKKGRK